MNSMCSLSELYIVNRDKLKERFSQNTQKQEED